MDYVKLLDQFAPYCAFHRDETSIPIAWETIKNNSELLISADGKQETLPKEYISKLDTSSPQEIIEDWLKSNEENRATFANGQLILMPNKDAAEMQGDFDVKKNIKSLPVHTLVSDVTLKNSEGVDEEFYRLTYVFLYRDNDPDFAFNAGDHRGDLEHVHFYIRKSQNENGYEDSIYKAYYGAHGEIEGQWFRGNQLKYENNHPVIFLAKGSHAAYKDLNTGFPFFSSTHYVPRIFGFASDKIEKAIVYQIKGSDLRPMPKPIIENAKIKFGGITLGKDFIKGPERVFNANSLVRQIPTTLKIGNWVLWEPRNHVVQEKHDERVENLHDLINEESNPSSLNLN